MPNEILKADACRWPVPDNITGKKRPCGWAESDNIRPHLKSHKVGPGGKSLTVAQYTKKFPKANLGPAWTPSPENLQKFLAKNPHRKDPVDEIVPKLPVLAVVESHDTTINEERLAKRTEELLRMVSHDPAAKTFCEQVAREEEYLQIINSNYDTEFSKGLSADISKLKALRQSKADTSETLMELTKHLNLTVKERRKDNQLGDTSTVSQIISNYANTLRKYSPARQELFLQQIRESRDRMAERLERRVISEAPNAAIEGGSVKELKNDADYTAAITDIGDAARDL